MKDDSMRQLLTEHLPPPPPEVAEPPLRTIRRRARRRTGTQVAMAATAVALIAGGAVVVLGNGGPATAPVAANPPPSTASSAAAANEAADMLYPTYLPPGYQEATDGATNTGPEMVLRYAAAQSKAPLVIRRQPETAQAPATGPSLRSMTVRNHAAQALPITNGGITVTWFEDSHRYSVSLEAPPNAQLDLDITATIDLLTAVAEGLRPGR